MAALIGWVVALIVALFSIAGSIFANIVAERYKSHRATVGVAAVFLAEINSLSDITLGGLTVENFEAIVVALKSNNISFPKMYVPEPAFGRVFDSNVDKLGLLMPDEVEAIVTYYNYLFGIRVILKNLAGGSSTDNVAAAAQIEIGLGFWTKCEAIRVKLIPSLRARSASHFRLLGP